MNTFNNDTASDELDLLSLIKDFKNILAKRKKLIFQVLGIGFLIGLIAFFASPKVYRSRMYISSEVLKGPSLILILDDLSRYIEENNYVESSKLLNLPVEKVKKISKIQIYSAKNFTEKEFSDIFSLDRDLNEEDSRGEYVIEVYVQDNTFLSDLEKGIVYYLGNNEFIKEKSVQRKQSLILVRDRLHKELNELDSLKYSLTNLYSQKGSNSSVYISNPSVIYNDILSLFRTEISTLNDLRSPDFPIIQPLVAYKKAYAPKLIPTMMVSMGVSLILCIFIILFLELRDRLKRVV